MTTGRAARKAINPEALVAFIDEHTEYRTDGFPRRKRRYINGKPQTADHARIIRRWRSGGIVGVTVQAANDLLAAYNLRLDRFSVWAAEHNLPAMTRGTIPTNRRTD